MKLSKNLSLERLGYEKCGSGEYWLGRRRCPTLIRVRKPTHLFPYPDNRWNTAVNAMFQAVPCYAPSLQKAHDAESDAVSHSTLQIDVIECRLKSMRDI